VVHFSGIIIILQGFKCPLLLNSFFRLGLTGTVFIVAIHTCMVISFSITIDEQKVLLMLFAICALHRTSFLLFFQVEDYKLNLYISHW